MKKGRTGCILCSGKTKYRLGVCSYCLSGLEKMREKKKVDKFKRNNVKPKTPLIFGKGIDRYLDSKYRRN